MLDDFREWLSDNLRYILLGLAALLVVIILFSVIRLAMGGKKSDKTGTTGGNSAVENATEGSADAGNTLNGTAAAGTAELVKDDAAVLTLMKKYYTALAGRDVGTLSQIVDPWDDEVQQKVFKSSVERYDNIAVYSKQGVDTGSYVVFVYFEGKLPNIDTTCPSLVQNYLVTAEGGSLKVKPIVSWDEGVLDYVESVLTDADVQKLISDVDSLCQAAVAKEPALADYVKTNNKSTADDGAAETDTTEETPESDAAAAVYPKDMTTTTGINIRQTASTDAAILGTLIAGTTVSVTEDAGDGWVHISFAGSTGTIDGYARLEYLTDTNQPAA